MLYEQIVMPSGRTLLVIYACFNSEDCRIDLQFYPIIADFGYSRGLCGNYNGIASDDVDGIVGDEPIEFTKKYMYVRAFVVI